MSCNGVECGPPEEILKLIICVQVWPGSVLSPGGVRSARGNPQRGYYWTMHGIQVHTILHLTVLGIYLCHDMLLKRLCILS